MSTKKEAKQAANKINFIVVVLATNQLIYIHVVPGPPATVHKRENMNRWDPKAKKPPKVRFSLP